MTRPRHNLFTEKEKEKNRSHQFQFLSLLLARIGAWWAWSRVLSDHVSVVVDVIVAVFKTPIGKLRGRWSVVDVAVATEEFFQVLFFIDARRASESECCCCGFDAKWHKQKQFHSCGFTCCCHATRLGPDMNFHLILRSHENASALGRETLSVVGVTTPLHVRCSYSDIAHQIISYRSKLTFCPRPQLDSGICCAGWKINYIYVQIYQFWNLRRTVIQHHKF